MTHASLFSGIGGFDLAARWAGWTNAFNCEIDPFCQTVLKYHFPNATQYTDIKTTDFTVWRGEIDVLTGGFPCQPFSVAGKRKGTDDNRYLWPQMLRAIREISPRWIVGENVRGIINWSDGLVFEQVCADLEAQGYEVQPVILPACAVDAPHRRDRVWFIAYRTDAGVEAMQQRGQDSVCGLGAATDSDSERCDNGSNNWEKRHIQIDKRITSQDKSERNQWERGPCAAGQIATNSDSAGFQEESSQQSTTRIAGIDKKFAPDTKMSRQEQKQSWRADERVLFSDHWANFPTQSPVCGRNDGLSDRLDGITFPKWRAESIKAYGNAIVPQVALRIFNTINQITK